MRVMVWNCQEAGSSLVIPQIKEVKNLHSPNIIILFEKKNKKHYMDMLKRKIGMDKGFTVDDINKAGG